jgi:hypothetical protein
MPFVPSFAFQSAVLTLAVKELIFLSYYENKNGWDWLAFRIFSRRPRILTEVSCDFTQPLQASIGIVPQGHDRFLPHPLQFIIH